MALEEIISDDDFDGLPDDPRRRFPRLESICRRNMYDMFAGNEGYDSKVRKKYVEAMLVVAEELNMPGLSRPRFLTDGSLSLRDFQVFEEQVKSVCIRLRLGLNNGKLDSVRLAERTRGRIEQQIAVLRRLIEAEVEPEKRKHSLLKRLDELSLELSQPRVRFAVVLGVLAAVAACTTIGADGPKAIHNITALIGIDKMAEDAEVERLGAPAEMKALPAPSGTSDDIPF